MTKIICFHGCGQNPQKFKSLLKSLVKEYKDNEKWIFPKGPYYKKDGGWGWYNRDYDREESEDNPIQDLDEYKNIGKCILLGFSEGAEFALELSQYLRDIQGVVAISPSYSNTIKNIEITCPVIMITSINDDKIFKKYTKKWRKLINSENLTDIIHFKGHKVYLPKQTRDVIHRLF